MLQCYYEYESPYFSRFKRTDPRRYCHRVMKIDLFPLHFNYCIVERKAILNLVGTNSDDVKVKLTYDCIITL